MLVSEADNDQHEDRYDVRQHLVYLFHREIRSGRDMEALLLQ